MVRVPDSGVSITVQCEGEDLPEYAHEVDDKSKSATCYIPSVEGKHFQLCFLRPASKTSLIFRVYFDGRRAPGINFVSGSSKKDQITIQDSARVDGSMKRRLVFSQLKLTDEEDALSTRSYIGIDALGTIQVMMSHAVFVPHSFPHARAVDNWYNDIVHSGAIHERVKKDGGHIVSLGEEIRAPRFASSGGEWRALGPPQYKVTFRYAPYDVLRAREIIPSPPVLPATTSVTSLYDRTTSNPLPPAKVKREREDADDLSDQSGFSDEEEASMYARLVAKKMAKRSRLAKIKIEENSIPAGIFKRGEVIDLTVDD
ncbi:hypothetical protein BS47DRAFT_1398875 [Hydnum rufescens UP504]|uniref:DUF7918 domain-containing protein n=1 Tax=Hydnum rufescens UP504 TaxID=1448309 RepID=A0A9P6DR26_9AGAM|nr:hypothetical protein BS47DRAFT_1398875 [Hydnum rufescens UP504]